MNTEDLDKIMRVKGARLVQSIFGYEVFCPIDKKFQKVHGLVAKSWLKKDLGVISLKENLITEYRSKYEL